MHSAAAFVLYHCMVAHVLGCSSAYNYEFCFETSKFKWFVKPINSYTADTVNLSYIAVTGTDSSHLLTYEAEPKRRTEMHCLWYAGQCQDSAVAADLKDLIKKDGQFVPAGVFEVIEVQIVKGNPTSIMFRPSDQSTHMVCFMLGIPKLSDGSEALVCNLLYFHDKYQLTLKVALFIQTIQPFHSNMKYPTFTAVAVNQVTEQDKNDPLTTAKNWPFVYVIVNIGISSDSKRRKFVRNLNIFEPHAKKVTFMNFIAICIHEEPIQQAPSPIFSRKVIGGTDVNVVLYMTCKNAKLTDSGIAVVKVNVFWNSTAPKAGHLMKFNFISNSDLFLPPGNTTLMQEVSNDTVMIHYGENDMFAGFNMYDTASFDADKSAKELQKEGQFKKVFKKPTEDALKDKLAVNLVSGRKKRSPITPILSFNVPGISYQPPVFQFDKPGFKIVIVHDNSMFHQFIANSSTSTPLEWFHVSTFGDTSTFLSPPASLITSQPLDYNNPVDYIDTAGGTQSLNPQQCNLNACTSCMRNCTDLPKTDYPECKLQDNFEQFLPSFMVNIKRDVPPPNCVATWLSLPTTTVDTSTGPNSTTSMSPANTTVNTTNPTTSTTSTTTSTTARSTTTPGSPSSDVLGISIAPPIVIGIVQAAILFYLWFKRRQTKLHTARLESTFAQLHEKKGKNESKDTDSDKKKARKRNKKNKNKEKVATSDKTSSNNRDMVSAKEDPPHPTEQQPKSSNSVKSPKSAPKSPKEKSAPNSDQSNKTKASGNKEVKSTGHVPDVPDTQEPVLDRNDYVTTFTIEEEGPVGPQTIKWDSHSDYVPSFNSEVFNRDRKIMMEKLLQGQISDITQRTNTNAISNIGGNAKDGDEH